jgi:hypothetical protein
MLPFPSKEKRTCQLHLLLSEDEHTRLTEAAKDLGVTKTAISRWLFAVFCHNPNAVRAALLPIAKDITPIPKVRTRRRG